MVYLSAFFFIATAYVAVGYPVVVFVMSWFKARPVNCGVMTPSISVILCVRNERENITVRLQNLIDMDYPSELVEIIVVSDGSIDGTDDMVCSFSNFNVKLVKLETHKGKAVAINAGVAAASNDILLFCDARQRFNADVLKRLVSYFADDAIGAVSGMLILKKSEYVECDAGVNYYWRYEVWLRLNESRSGSVVGATGAIYAMRKELFKPLPYGTILDDVLTPMRVVLQGKRVVYAPEAKAFENVIFSDDTEMERKVRTIYGNMQLYKLAPELFSFRCNSIWFRFVSHKVIRLFLPALLLGCFTTSLFFLYGVIAYLQIVFWVVALVSWKQQIAAFPWRLFSLFCLLNLAIIKAWFRFVKNENVTWR